MNKDNNSTATNTNPSADTPAPAQAPPKPEASPTSLKRSRSINWKLCFFIETAFLALLIVAFGAFQVASIFIKTPSEIAMEKSLSEHETFAKEYGISPNNPFVYRNGDEIVDILKNGTGLVFLGFPDCPWCKAYVKYLNEVATDLSVNKIYYYNIKDAREENTKDYQKIVKILEERVKTSPEGLNYNDKGQIYVYVPTFISVVNGQIIGINSETSKDTAGAETPEDYWTEDRQTNLRLSLASLISAVQNSEDNCTNSCNK